ncbi:hypothetical protein [Terrabacter sp. Ter38]|uniref:hypothetical protein n=1 Tax=Terrabacter sp. Ter38 TaxID=2926030 RepID=UPI002118F148|nr:hypothetical protein [Terrabacter sp. Ter38]
MNAHQAVEYVQNAGAELGTAAFFRQEHAHPMTDHPVPEASSSEPVVPPVPSTGVPSAPEQPTPAQPTPAQPTPAQPTPAQPTSAPPAHAQVTGGRPGRLSGLKRFGGFLFAILAFFLFRALTADDGTHGIKTGECIASVGTDDFKKVDCGDSTSLGSVTFVEKNAPTDETSALALCAKHDATNAFTSATSDGGAGTIICVADRK